MAVHPLRLINVVGALDFSKPSQNRYLQPRFCVNILKVCFLDLVYQMAFLPSL